MPVPAIRFVLRVMKHVSENKSEETAFCKTRFRVIPNIFLMFSSLYVMLTAFSFKVLLSSMHP